MCVRTDTKNAVEIQRFVCRNEDDIAIVEVRD